MAEEAPHHHYDPLVDEPPKRRKKGGPSTAIIISVIVHAGVGYYIWKSKIEPKYKEYSDEAVKVDLVKPRPRRRPPPPPPPPNTPPPPPPPVTPRPPVAPPPDIAPPPPLAMAPIEKPAPLPPPPAPPPAAPPPPHIAQISNPDWLHKPSGDDMAQYYPPRAMDLGKEGKATIRCTVSAKGTVENCSVVSQDPPGLGFDGAALRLSKLFKMKPKTSDGQSVDGAEVTIPIAFKLAG